MPYSLSPVLLCYNRVMGRIVTYSILGLLLGLVFAPVFTMSVRDVLVIGVAVAFIGALIGIGLNRVSPPQPHQFSIDAFIEYSQNRGPWIFMPRRMRESIFARLREHFKSDSGDQA